MELLDYNSDFVFLSHFETWNNYFSNVVLKLCATWVHVSLGIVNRLQIFYVNVPNVVLGTYYWKTQKLKTLMGIEKPVNNYIAINIIKIQS
jgi:hypothetical protein